MTVPMTRWLSDLLLLTRRFGLGKYRLKSRGWLWLSLLGAGLCAPTA